MKILSATFCLMVMLALFVTPASSFFSRPSKGPRANPCYDKCLKEYSRSVEHCPKTVENEPISVGYKNYIKQLESDPKYSACIKPFAKILEDCMIICPTPALRK